MVDQEGLYQALKENIIAGAGIGILIESWKLSGSNANIQM